MTWGWGGCLPNYRECPNNNEKKKKDLTLHVRSLTLRNTGSNSIRQQSRALRGNNNTKTATARVRGIASNFARFFFFLRFFWGFVAGFSGMGPDKPL